MAMVRLVRRDGQHRAQARVARVLPSADKAAGVERRVDAELRIGVMDPCGGSADAAVATGTATAAASGAPCARRSRGRWPGPAASLCRTPRVQRVCPLHPRVMLCNHVR
jgi:hypothetical protein